MNGSAWLFSAFRDVVARVDAVDGAKAEADPTRIAAVRARNFMVRRCYTTFIIVDDVGKQWRCLAAALARYQCAAARMRLAILAVQQATKSSEGET